MQEGCLTKPFVQLLHNSDKNNATKINIYRAKNDWTAAAIDFRVVLNGEYIGSIKKGTGIERFIPAGDISLEVHPHFMGKPDTGQIKVSLEVGVGEEYTFRFSQHLDDFSYMPMGDKIKVFRISGHTELNLVPNEAWLEKR